MINKSGKGNENTLGFILTIVLLWVVIFLAVSFIGILKDPITFSIRLNTNGVPQGTDGILIYEIKNWGLSTISNVTVGTEILNMNDNQFAFREFGNLQFMKTNSGAYVFKTNNLARGDYTVKSVLSYKDSSGNLQNKVLTLAFKVI